MQLGHPSNTRDAHELLKIQPPTKHSVEQPTIGTLREGQNLLVDLCEGHLGRDVSAASEALCGHQIRHYLLSTGHHSLTRESMSFCEQSSYQR